MLDETVFLETIKRRYLGKWIGLKENDVLVVSDSHDEVIRELRKRNVDGAYVFYSPTETEKQYRFLLSKLAVAFPETMPLSHEVSCLSS